MISVSSVVVLYFSIADMSFVSFPPALANELQPICDAYTNVDNTQVCKYKDDIIDACFRHGYASKVWVTCKQLGIHPKNRDGQGVHCMRAQTRVSNILAVGCSLSAIEANLVAIEDHPMLKRIEAKTLQQCSTNAKYARYKAGEIVGGTLGAGHAVHGFSQLHDEVPCDIPNISVDGRMSQEKCFRDKMLKKFVTEPFEVTMLKWGVEEAYPIIPHIIQSALNTVHQIAEGEGWTQMLQKIVGEASQYTSQQIPWTAIAKQVIKSKSPPDRGCS